MTSLLLQVLERMSNGWPAGPDAVRGSDRGGNSDPPVSPMSPPVAQFLRQPIGNWLAQPPEQLRQSDVRLVVEGLEECL